MRRHVQYLGHLSVNHFFRQFRAIDGAREAKSQPTQEDRSQVGGTDPFGARNFVFSQSKKFTKWFFAVHTGSPPPERGSSISDLRFRRVGSDMEARDSHGPTSAYNVFFFSC